MFVSNSGNTTYMLLNADELWCTTALIYVNNGQYYAVSRQTPDKEARPNVNATITFYHALFATQMATYIVATESNLY